MKVRYSLVSNSSSTSFIVNTKLLADEQYRRLWSVLNSGNYIEPQFDNPNMVYVSTGMSDGNHCLYKWWVLKKWFTDNNIEHEDLGSGCPGSEQKTSDFIFYITEKEDEQEVDPIRAKQFRDWLFREVSNKRIDDAAKAIGITKEEIKNNKFNLELYEDLLKDL